MVFDPKTERDFGKDSENEGFTKGLPSFCRAKER